MPRTGTRRAGPAARPHAAELAGRIAPRRDDGGRRARRSALLRQRRRRPYALGELASVNHAPALSAPATDDDADAAYVFRLERGGRRRRVRERHGRGLSLSTALDAGALYRADFEFLAAVSERGYGADPRRARIQLLEPRRTSSGGTVTRSTPWRSRCAARDADLDSAVDIYTAVEATVDWLYARLRLRHAAYITQGLYHVAGLHATLARLRRCLTLRSVRITRSRTSSRNSSRARRSSRAASRRMRAGALDAAIGRAPRAGSSSSRRGPRGPWHRAST